MRAASSVMKDIQLHQHTVAGKTGYEQGSGYLNVFLTGNGLNPSEQRKPGYSPLRTDKTKPLVTPMHALKLKIE